jgi:hypothetical protein
MNILSVSQEKNEKSSSEVPLNALSCTFVKSLLLNL